VVRRQRVLKDAGQLASIGDYRRLRETRTDLPALPHLFVVIDEFGELLTAEPEFIDLFLQIGRIGRSIGVHLLLSSQRIEGGKLRGLDTYLSYRLGLRTFSESESQVMLGTTDGYHLPALPATGTSRSTPASTPGSGPATSPAPPRSARPHRRAAPAGVRRPYNGLRRPEATGAVTVTTLQARTDGPRWSTASSSSCGTSGPRCARSGSTRCPRAWPSAPCWTGGPTTSRTPPGSAR